MAHNNFTEGIANVAASMKHSMRKLDADIEAYYEMEQAKATRKATAENAIIEMSRKLADLKVEADKSDKFNRRISIMTFVVAVLAFIASIVVPAAIVLLTR